MKVISSEKIPIKMWLENIEGGALQQAKNLANLPFSFKHIALMPDCHEGYGMPIGGVLATENVVIPNAVGVDIGCGIRACKLNTFSTILNREMLLEITEGIRKEIPLGFKHHLEKQKWSKFEEAPDVPIIQRELENAKYQLGTLGDGNHFIEIQKDEDKKIWIMIHSGSRNFGLKIAKEYNDIAKKYCERWHSKVMDISKDLAFLPIEERDCKDYILAMNYALLFAKENRKRMMSKIIDIFRSKIEKNTIEEVIDIHHNYARWENHFNRNVIIHRKGATSARSGEIGIIPGSQGTNSYIVEGLGNPLSFMSCSHGAGRKMGRGEAIRTLSLESEIKKLNEKGIIHSVEENDDLQEAPGSYKDIDEVMENQKDLVKIRTKLEPIAVIKSKKRKNEYSR